MQKNDEREPGGIEHQPDGLANIVIHRCHSRMDQCGLLIVDEELIEPHRGILWHGRNSIDTVNNFVDASHLPSCLFFLGLVGAARHFVGEIQQKRAFGFVHLPQ